MKPLDVLTVGMLSAAGPAMRIRLSLAAIACLLSAQAVAQPPKAASRELNAILSMTEDQAIAIATSMAAGTTEPIAINDVNRVARAEVCRHYIGSAVVEIEKTENHQGNLFMLAGFRPIEGGALADWVAPSTAFPFAWNLERAAAPATNWLTRPRGDRIHFCGAFFRRCLKRPHVANLPSILAKPPGRWRHCCQKSAECCRIALSG